MRKLNTGDVFKMFRIIKHSNLKEEIKNLFIQGKSGVNATEISMNFSFVLVDAMANEEIENEVYSFLAGVAETDEKSIKERSLDGMMEMFREIEKGNNLKVFFDAVASLAKA